MCFGTKEILLKYMELFKMRARLEVLELKLMVRFIMAIFKN